MNLLLDTYTIVGIVQQSFYLNKYSFKTFFEATFLPSHLLLDKSKKTYIACFQGIKDYMSEKDMPKTFAAEYCMADWEKALRDALEQVFGKGGGSGIEIKGCHFHFAKCLFKRVIKAGLKNYYSNSKKARKHRLENSSNEKSKETGEEFATFLRAAIGTVPKMPTKY